MIWATWSRPYLFCTYLITSSRRSWQKSISKSGMDTRSGFKKRSNSKPHRIGSKSVINSAHATTEPAPDPRPGPTGIPWAFDQPTKSATIKKYPGKPIWIITSSSKLNRAWYDFAATSFSTSLMLFLYTWTSKRDFKPLRAWRRNSSSSVNPSPQSKGGKIGSTVWNKKAQRLAITTVL